jgi:fatty-acyl-CoA synthase
VQYIGELCRYLCNAPPNADDAKLDITYAVGNGLRPDVWTKFQVCSGNGGSALKIRVFILGPAYPCLQERYNVKRVIEFYGATEGNVNMYNSTGRCHRLCRRWTLLTGMRRNL